MTIGGAMDFNHELVFHFSLTKAYLDGQISHPKFERQFFSVWNDFNDKYEFEVPEDDKVHQLLDLRDQIFVALDSCTKRLKPNRDFGELTTDEFKELLEDYYRDFLQIRFFFLSNAS